MMIKNRHDDNNDDDDDDNDTTIVLIEAVQASCLKGLGLKSVVKGGNYLR